MLMPGNQSAPELKAFLLATLFLVAGIVVYVLDRGATVYFLAAWPFGPAAPAIFGPLGSHLPTLLHPPIFILITAAILRPWPRTLPAICAAWFTVECLFELGQMTPFDTRIAATMSPWLDSVPIVRITADYFTRGTFDPLDILSIAIGTVVAYLLARRVLIQGEP